MGQGVPCSKWWIGWMEGTESDMTCVLNHHNPYLVSSQVVAFEDFKAHNNNQPSMAGAKAAGKYRIEGKNYEVKDGDIVSGKGWSLGCVMAGIWGA